MRLNHLGSEIINIYTERLERYDILKKFYFTGGWKMNLGVIDSINYARKLKAYIDSISDLSKDLKLVIFPDLLSIYSVLQVFKNSPVGIGSQDLFWEDAGAYTGEVSPLFLNEIGCSSVLLGHPERSINLKENYQMVNRKVKAALKNNIIPFLIVSEKKDKSSVKKISQLREDISRYVNGLKIEEIVKIIIIYEPQWAINTDEAAPSDYISEMVLEIRSFLNKEFGSKLGDNICISYGGGVNKNNFKDILKIKQLNGIGLGKASLDFDFFSQCINIVNNKLNKSPLVV